MNNKSCYLYLIIFILTNLLWAPTGDGWISGNFYNGIGKDMRNKAYDIAENVLCHADFKPSSPDEKRYIAGIKERRINPNNIEFDCNKLLEEIINNKGMVEHHVVTQMPALAKAKKIQI